MNYFEFYAGDYLRDTTRLTLIDHGAYLRLLIAYYSEEAPLPADLAELYVITCAVSKADKDAVKRVAEKFFPVSDLDGLRHKNRVDEEIAKAQKRIAAARANGAKGGKKKEPEKTPVGYPLGNPLGCPTEPQRPTHSGEALHTPHAIHQPTAEARADAPPAKNRGTRLPADWDPGPELTAWARAERPDVATATELAKFRDHWASAAGKAGVKLDWAATFRNWIRNARTEVRHANFQTSHRLSAVERVEQAIRERRESDPDDDFPQPFAQIGHG